MAAARIPILRIAVGVVYVWFGALKLEPASFRPWLMRSVARASVRLARRRAWLVPLAAVAEPVDQPSLHHDAG